MEFNNLMVCRDTKRLRSTGLHTVSTLSQQISQLVSMSGGKYMST